LCGVYQAAIISQRGLRLLGDGWLRRKQPKRQERKHGRKLRNIFGRARRSDEIRADLFVILSGSYFIPALQIAGE
jgi:anaerobic glycerol-3-phosphate dehydrogenase